MPKLRSRLVNFRVTDDEFQQLKTACDRHGNRCLSAFGRELTLNTSNPEGRNFAHQLAALDRLLTTLQVSMSSLVNTLAVPATAVNASEKVKVEVPSCVS